MPEKLDAFTTGRQSSGWPARKKESALQRLIYPKVPIQQRSRPF
jgi:hypothetical protein